MLIVVLMAMTWTRRTQHPPVRVSVSALGLPTCQGGVVAVTPCVNVHHHCQLNIVIILAIVIIIIMS